MDRTDYISLRVANGVAGTLYFELISEFWIDMEELLDKPIPF